ncbi:AGAP002256-PA-like protein [Anopheles sinensis]|uniref:AGAP002256-PA-like protein n=1 Tax=Anopheles sinensis TaxID=74873 RepID=A0A084VWL3_ANOSI|nr:AGAP002256-PA-like protein [Anopheles sinensis]
MTEDERTLWCGNLSEKVTEELLYELCLQAGPVENVKIPRDSDKRQRSYAFITYVHACSVEYAIRIFEGSALFKRQLTLHRKTRNGPNPAAPPKENFKYSSGNGRFHDDPPLNTIERFDGPMGHQQEPFDNNGVMFNGNSSNMFEEQQNNAPMQSDMLSAMATALVSNGCTPELLMQLGQQMLGADLPTYDDNSQHNNSYRTKMNHQDRQHRNPYSRDDRYGRNNDRNDSRHRNESRYRNEHDNRSNDRKRDYRRRR